VYIHTCIHIHTHTYILHVVFLVQTYIHTYIHTSFDNDSIQTMRAHAQKLQVYYEEKGKEALITGTGQIRGKRCKIKGTRGEWKMNSASISMECTYEGVAGGGVVAEAQKLHGEVTRRNGKILYIKGTCADDASSDAQCTSTEQPVEGGTSKAQGTGFTSSTTQATSTTPQGNGTTQGDGVRLNAAQGISDPQATSTTTGSEFGGIPATWFRAPAPITASSLAQIFSRAQGGTSTSPGSGFGGFGVPAARATPATSAAQNPVIAFGGMQGGLSTIPSTSTTQGGGFGGFGVPAISTIPSTSITSGTGFGFDGMQGTTSTTPGSGFGGFGVPAASTTPATSTTQNNGGLNATQDSMSTTQSSRPLVLYMVESEPVEKTWYGRYDNSHVVFCGGVLVTKGSLVHPFVQAKYPVCAENNLMQVQVRTSVGVSASCKSRYALVLV
jgi:hypothetical protein